MSKKIKKRFLQFLRDEEVAFMYRENWKSQFCCHTKKIKRPENYIRDAFYWAKAEFGSVKLWSNLSIKWIFTLLEEGLLFYPRSYNK